LPRSPEGSAREEDGAAAAPRGVRILGIDPGSRVTGFGVVDFSGGRARHVASGCLGARGEGLGERLRSIHAAVAEVVARYHPDELAVEQVFIHRNPAAALKLGQARGAALLAGVEAGLALHEYMPNQVKQAVTGRGHATKEQVQHMIRVLLGLAELPPSDAADALAVAVCHGHVRQTLGRIQAAAGKGGR